MTRSQKYKDTYKKYYEDNKEAVLSKNREWKYNNPERWLWNSAKQRAKKDNIEFDIEPSDIVIPSLCPFLNVEFKWASRYSPSIDRIDNSKGYIKGNVQIISMQANKMKNDATELELKLFCYNYLEKYK